MGKVDEKMSTSKPVSRTTGTKDLALQLILLMGLVSALGDITYETGRSVSGPYLAYLGASAAMVGLVAGLGEFLGYGLRLLSGYLAGRTRAYWTATFIGYGLILCVPLLAYVNRWELAALLLLLERVGKAIRSPSRDTILSHATHHTGRGWGFAIHEALDQVGAVIGPLIFTAVFVQRSSYRDGFSILWIPALLTMVVLLIARLRVPQPESLEAAPLQNAPKSIGKSSLSRAFWVYVGFSFLSVAGFANFQIVSYHLVQQAVVPAVQIPILYAVAMGADALAALAIGKVYDSVGLKSLLVIPLATVPLPFLALSQQYALAVVGAVLWGVVMAVHETIMRAAIADLTAVEQRAFAYGVFNTIYGAAWFAGGAILGFLYDFSKIWLFAFVILTQAAALFVLTMLRRQTPPQKSLK